MSTYHRLDRNPIHDIYAERFKKSEANSPAAAAEAPDALRSKRKAEPANIALPITRAWAASLPNHIQLAALISTYPRIANYLAASWNEPAATHAYLDQLIVDHRGNRQGFPPGVRAELVALRNYYNMLRPEH